jgi:pseudouridine synthase, RluA family
MLKNLEFIVDESQNGITVLSFLHLKNVSNRMIRKLKLINEGITSNGIHIRTIDKLKFGDIIRLKIIEDEKIPVPAEGEIPQIIYEDESMIVFNKPKSMPVHQSRGHYTDALSNYAAAHFLKNNLKSTFRAINRLDRDTTGIVIAAKNQYAANKLSMCVINKKYLAVVNGKLKNNGEINAPIKRKEGSIIERKVDEKGAFALTKYKVLKCKNDITLLEVELATGRTHQIRVHFAYIGHPLVGDTLYGLSSDLIDRQALHCSEMIIKHPISSKKICLKADFPEDMKKLIKLEKDYNM